MDDINNTQSTDKQYIWQGIKYWYIIIYNILDVHTVQLISYVLFFLDITIYKYIFKLYNLKGADTVYSSEMSG
jgi:hypothetical protein